MELGCIGVGNILNIRPGAFGVASEGAAAISSEKQTLHERLMSANSLTMELRTETSPSACFEGVSVSLCLH